MANSKATNRDQRGPHLKEHHEKAVELITDVIHCSLVTQVWNAVRNDGDIKKF